VSAPKGSGLTTLMYAILRAHDAFLTHIHTIERAPDIDLEGITQNKLAPNATGAEEAKQTRWVIDQQPDTIAITSIEDTSTAMELVKFAKEGKRVYIGVRAGNTQEALAQWVRLIGNEKRALEQLILVISGRVVRKLCNACKVGYAPDPTTLKKLNMDPDRVSKLYQERKEPMRDPKGQPVLCEFCHELHFKGRSGVYEMFIIDEDAKAAAEGGVTSPQMKMAFRKQRAKYLQEQALLLVEKGDTSVQEVLRVLKSDQKK
jgi:type II secretory ATPase GspE/PulE/Tfp pilus assembly ATPase PilB-like protein